MRLFTITNTNKFTGEIEVLFAETLLKLDFTKATITPDVAKAFKNALPITFEAFAQGNWCGGDTTIVEANYDIPVEDFTREYPYQRNTHLLPPIWAKLPIADRHIAVTNARAYRLYCERNKWYNPKIAASWLKNKEYLNDWSKM